jgi:hypothetical protein
LNFHQIDFTLQQVSSFNRPYCHYRRPKTAHKYSTT